MKQPHTVPLAATVTGQGPPLIILHGLFGSRRNWATITRRFEPYFTCHALDLRNHGESPWSEDMSYTAMAQDIARYITDHSLENVSVLGHSMGGKVAMALALTDPHLIERLVIVDIAPTRTVASLGQYAQALLQIDLSQIERRSDAEKLLTPAIADPVIRNFLLQGLVLEEKGWSWRYNLPILSQAMDTLIDFPKDLLNRVFTGPTLSILGEKSSYVQREHHPLMERLFPNLSWKIIEGAGHWVHADNSEAFAEAVTAFLG